MSEGVVDCSECQYRLDCANWKFCPYTGTPVTNKLIVLKSEHIKFERFSARLCVVKDSTGVYGVAIWIPVVSRSSAEDIFDTVMENKHVLDRIQFIRSVE